jgi:ribose transport system ATP-binding protein
MAVTTSNLLLEASDVAKTYGAVVALRSASLAVRPGEVHALMGANGAGKSTLVKILSGAVRPDAGTIAVRGRPFIGRSPGEARRGGIVSVYQEPALIPDLDIRSNLRLTDTPVEPFRHWLDELGIKDAVLGTQARRLPLATLRIIDLARALSIEPDVLMLDEMTAALPANLTERVLEVVGRQRGTERSIIFISHRMIEIAAVCDRATVLREGATVGVVDVTAGSEDRIVELMLGQVVERLPGAGERAQAAARAEGIKPRIAARGLASGTKLQDVSFEVYPGEVVGVVALEGQGQDELFDVLAGSERPSSGEIAVDGAPVTFRHPGDAIRAGVVYVAADRADALLMQRSVRENIALPLHARILKWGVIDLSGEGRMVDRAVETLQIDARAGNEVRRLSGGNQQKVTIARWVAQGVHTMLCFDPTRGIDIGTKNQIYVLLRELAAAGAAVLLYTSELKEVELVCDRAIVIFGGRVVRELTAADADEPALLRAAYNLRADSVLPEDTVAEVVAHEQANEAAAPATPGPDDAPATPAPEDAA